jgi:hypothetical protein
MLLVQKELGNQLFLFIKKLCCNHAKIDVWQNGKDWWLLIRMP